MDYPLLADNLVFLTNDSSFDKLDRDILYSILDKRPKRAKRVLLPQRPGDRRALHPRVHRQRLWHGLPLQGAAAPWGFKVNQRVNTYLYQVVADLVERGQLAPQNHKYSIYLEPSQVGDFRFCLIRKTLSPRPRSRASTARIELKYLIRSLCGSPARWYGLENSSLIYEYVPLFSKTQAPAQAHAPRCQSERGPAALAAKPGGQDSDEDDEDIFSVQMRGERDAHRRGGHAPSWAATPPASVPLVIDEDKEEENEEEAARSSGGRG